MIVAIVRFPLRPGVSPDAARSSFEGSAPSYQGLPGLVRKYYLYEPDGPTGGGVYLWTSRAAADAVYDDAWRARLTERFGVAPQVEYFDCPVIVDAEQIVVT
jgi:hypothetical protein